MESNIVSCQCHRVCEIISINWIMMLDSCNISVLTSQLFSISSKESNEKVIIRSLGLNSPSLFQYFTYFHSSSIDITNTYLLSIIVSNEEGNIWKPCKDLFSMDFLIELSKYAMLYENINIYLNMCACIIPSMEIEIVTTNNIEVSLFVIPHYYWYYY